ncbi:hypothetical protein V6N13_044437 [Hibiscus sabdariffa]|uniref:Non-haem dioxygenase N-terminal domain-containing protein n=1 Tax=Hibiscus sabdariffa TaxID=183260 RepID=A0ABR2RII3_9ROSI
MRSFDYAFGAISGFWILMLGGNAFRGKVSNGLGTIFGAIQLVLYAYFYFDGSNDLRPSEEPIGGHMIGKGKVKSDHLVLQNLPHINTATMCTIVDLSIFVSLNLRLTELVQASARKRLCLREELPSNSDYISMSFIPVFQFCFMAPVPSFSIKVGHIDDDVQELNKAKPTTVPERFVQHMADRLELTANISSSSDIPIIDLSKLMKGDKDEHFSEVMQLKTACEEWGFLQVLNHGIDPNVLENIEKVAEDFFMLPLHEKQNYRMAPGTVQGYGQSFVFSENQKLD